MSYTEEDYLQLSGIQHFCYCRRQWYLIHVLQAWADDARTTAGNLFHDKADDPFIRERRGDVIISRSIPVSSSILGLSGRCDVVEFFKDDSGTYVPQIGFKCSIHPVEYKVGRKKAGEWDRIQLCAEAMCLEESFGTNIDHGYLYYGLERKRTEVRLTLDLRQKTECLAREMHESFAAGTVFVPSSNKECLKCSLYEICMPFPTKDVNEFILRNRER